VYKAKHVRTSEVYVVKVMKASSDQAMADVEREAKVMRGLHHQNIVGFVETLIIKPFYCIVLEFVCGRDLKELTTIKMSNNTTWAEVEMKPILRGILDGLVYLHLQDIIHRDIKGANIMYSDDGVVKLVDFGISAQQSERKDENEEIIDGVGSPCWMAPESVQRYAMMDTTVEATTKSDIWAVGAVAIELFTGRPPYHQHMLIDVPSAINSQKVAHPSPALNVMLHILSDQPTIPANASPQFQDFLGKCFIRDPLTRHSAVQLVGHEFLNH